ncbi:MAG: transporter substrate binding protein [Betaproteobacteria bacterium]|nr:transporter substrate binding protein [Betaproteobacteria bacterium]
MISRRRLLVALAAAAAVPHSASGQQKAKPARPARVGVLSYISEPDIALTMLHKGLAELGHVEGKTYVAIARYANGDFKRLPGLIDELEAEKIDVLVARGPSADFTKAVRARVPVVFAFSGDPIAAGFGDSLRKPGRNMTGITFMAMELSAKRIEVLRETVPKAARIALLSNPEHSGELSEYRVTEDTARRLGATITRHLVRNPQELTKEFGAIRASTADSMIVFPDSLTLTRRKEIADFAAKARLPCMYGWTEFVEAGGLMSYGPSIIESFKTLAIYVDKIIKGGNASNIPIEQVSDIRLSINLAAAKAMGLIIPQPILVRADKLIE